MRIKRYEKVIAVGIAIAGIGMCCLDSTGPAFIGAVIVTAVGLAAAYAGIRIHEKRMDAAPTRHRVQHE